MDSSTAGGLQEINNTISGNVSRKVTEADPNQPIDEDTLLAIYHQYIENRSLGPTAFWTLIILYSILITIGTIGNLFVVTAVARKPRMRTARNMFILNLAISDLLLCLVTTPLTLMEVVTKHWPLVKWVFICRLIGVLQGISVFVSTITITAIALDRYQVIVYPTKKSLHVMGAIGVIGIIWFLALLLVSPLYLYRDLKVFNLSLKGLDSIGFCREDWPIMHGRAYYSAFSLVVQYIIPIIIVSMAYQKIYFKLKNRHVSTNFGVESKKETERGKKLHKTNSLLIAIAVVYGVSWLPLNLLNLIADVYSDSSLDQEKFLIMFSACHMMGMSSACSNPLLYGWLNENFKKEFKEILSCVNNQPDVTQVIRREERRESPIMTQNLRFDTTNVNKTLTDQENENPHKLISTEVESTILAR